MMKNKNKKITIIFKINKMMKKVKQILQENSKYKMLIIYLEICREDKQKI